LSAMPEFVPAAPPPQALPRPRRRHQTGVHPERYVMTLISSVASVCILAGWIGGYARMTVEGYRVNALQSQLAELQKTDRSLSSRAALLADPGRLVTGAQQLSMVRAAPADTLYLESAGSPIRVSARPASSRLAMAPSP
jgi:hypothetical protein